MVDIFLISGLVDEDFRLFTMLRLLRAAKFRKAPRFRLLWSYDIFRPALVESKETIEMIVTPFFLPIFHQGHEHVWESPGDTG